MRYLAWFLWNQPLFFHGQLLQHLRGLEEGHGAAPDAIDAMDAALFWWLRTPT